MLSSGIYPSHTIKGNDWQEITLPAYPIQQTYRQGMSYMLMGLDPDQQYEVKVQSR